MHDNIFVQLGNIKLEIERDLCKINSIKNYLDLKSITIDNKQLSNKVLTINKDFNKRIEEFNTQNTQLQKELIRMGNANENKEKEMNKLKSQITSLREEKEETETKLQKKIKENESLNKTIIDKEQYKELNQMNIDYLKQLYS